MSLIHQIFSELENPSLYGFVKSIQGHFYYTEIIDGSILPLLFPTRLQKENLEVFVGDIVQIDFQNKTIKHIIPRLSLLSRPKVANVDRALIVVSATNTEIEHLDRLLVHAGIALPFKPIICVTKIDLINMPSVFRLYESLNYKVMPLNNINGQGLNELLDLLNNETIVLAGLSGAGKSSLLNLLSPKLKLKTGAVSHKTEKGTHTTRHTEIFKINKNNKVLYILDTPGFSRLDAQYNSSEIIQERAFPEIGFAKNTCRFLNCKHKFEEDCEVNFSSDRHNTYIKLLDEADNWEKNQKESNKNKEQNTKMNSKVHIPMLSSSQRSISRKSFKQSIQNELNDIIQNKE